MNKYCRIKKTIRSKIKNRPLLEILFQILLHRDSKDWLMELSTMPSNGRLVEIKEVVGVSSLSQCNDDILCLINAGGSNDGFFATLRWILDGLYFCDKFGFIPIARFPDDSLYKSHKYPDDVNVFEYFFMPVSVYSEADISKHIQALYSVRNRILAEKLNKDIGYSITDEYIVEMAKVYRKYILFKNEIAEKLKLAVEELGINNLNTIGVHARGTDYKKNYKNHPKYVSEEKYFQQIDILLSTSYYNNVFLATDDEDILKKFKKKYRNELVFYGDVNRSQSGEGIHTSLKIDGYDIGYQVIRDMFTLSQCRAFISGLSQVSIMTRIYKKSCGDEFRDDTLIDGGINQFGRVFKVKKDSK